MKELRVKEAKFKVHWGAADRWRSTGLCEAKRAFLQRWNCIILSLKHHLKWWKIHQYKTNYNQPFPQIFHLKKNNPSTHHSQSLLKPFKCVSTRQKTLDILNHPNQVSGGTLSRRNRAVRSLGRARHVGPAITPKSLRSNKPASLENEHLKLPPAAPPVGVISHMGWPRPSEPGLEEPKASCRLRKTSNRRRLNAPRPLNFHWAAATETVENIHQSKWLFFRDYLGWDLNNNWGSRHDWWTRTWLAFMELYFYINE